MQFASQKMGDEFVTIAVREKLERDLDQLQAALKQTNEANKPPPPPPPKRKKDNSLLIAALNVVGNIIGAAIKK